MLEALCKSTRDTSPIDRTLPLYESGVRYQRESGTEDWIDFRRCSRPAGATARISPAGAWRSCGGRARHAGPTCGSADRRGSLPLPRAGDALPARATDGSRRANRRAGACPTTSRIRAANWAWFPPRPPRRRPDVRAGRHGAHPAAPRREDAPAGPRSPEAPRIDPRRPRPGPSRPGGGRLRRGGLPRHGRGPAGPGATSCAPGRSSRARRSWCRRFRECRRILAEVPRWGWRRRVRGRGRRAGTSGCSAWGPAARGPRLPETDEGGGSQFPGRRVEGAAVGEGFPAEPRAAVPGVLREHGRPPQADGSSPGTADRVSDGCWRAGRLDFRVCWESHTRLGSPVSRMWIGSGGYCKRYPNTTAAYLRWVGLFEAEADMRLDGDIKVWAGGRREGVRAAHRPMDRRGPSWCMPRRRSGQYGSRWSATSPGWSVRVRRRSGIQGCRPAAGPARGPSSGSRHGPGAFRPGGLASHLARKKLAARKRLRGLLARAGRPIGAKPIAALLFRLPRGLAAVLPGSASTAPAPGTAPVRPRERLAVAPGHPLRARRGICPRIPPRKPRT